MQPSNPESVRPIPPEPTLRRLPWYLACVNMLRSSGVEHVSSTAISKKINVDASQIAKDLSVLPIKGKTRIGYEVSALERALKDFLGFTAPHPAVMMGVGSLGAALIADRGLQRFGLDVVAGFDTDPSIIGNCIKGVPVFDVSELYVRRAAYGAEIGILAVPVEHAQSAANLLVASGVKAIWNFTPYRITVPARTVVENTSIYADLAVIYSRLKSS
ncbi:MAG: redox-sensing transcriptional repressor Rex [Firmicutes bacterium]|nr:redox-sensing transcriptional repressor Rex [Bacillota bacterium]MCM1401092.1 redox-sensing transcriptional repressor Rex [Bacteroides sp.]MCM1477011.1 redox-sensing transcriptional repressor Rex [Bacteroides sp.]